MRHTSAKFHTFSAFIPPASTLRYKIIRGNASSWREATLLQKAILLMYLFIQTQMTAAESSASTNITKPDTRPAKAPGSNPSRSQSALCNQRSPGSLPDFSDDTNDDTDEDLPDDLMFSIAEPWECNCNCMLAVLYSSYSAIRLSVWFSLSLSQALCYWSSMWRVWMSSSSTCPWLFLSDPKAVTCLWYLLSRLIIQLKVLAM